MTNPIRLFDVPGRLRGAMALLALLSICPLVYAGADTGAKTYLSACAGCHGASEENPGFAPNLRRFKGDEFAFLSVVKNGRPGTIMSGWQGVLSDAEILTIRSYLKEGSVAGSRLQVKDSTSQEDSLAAR